MGIWTLLYRALREAERRRVGRDPNPRAAIMDAQSVKTVEEPGCIRGYDAHKCIKGRKRRLLVGTLGLPLSFYVMSANVRDTYSARCLSGWTEILRPTTDQDLGRPGRPRTEPG